MCMAYNGLRVSAAIVTEPHPRIALRSTAYEADMLAAALMGQTFAARILANRLRSRTSSPRPLREKFRWGTGK